MTVVIPEILPDVCKCEVVHELPANRWHGHRIRLRHSDLKSGRIAKAMGRELGKIRGITGVRVNHLTKSVLFFAEREKDKQDAIQFLDREFDWRAHRGITAEEVEDLLTGDNPAGAWIGVARYFLLRPFLPPAWRMVLSTLAALPFIFKGIRSLAKGKLNVDVLDAAALSVALLNRDYGTAAMLSMLLAVGDALEVWTRQRSLSSLSESLALDIDKVWVLDANGVEEKISIAQVRQGDLIVVNAGSSIPADGIVYEGSALVNQAALTGEPIPVEREKGGAVYAGTIVESGRIVIRVSQIGESTRLHQVLSFMEQSEAQKSAIEAHYTKLADKAVPLTFALAGLVWFITGNLMRASAVLLVDYSCTLKLATPLSALTAMRVGAQNGTAVRGGKYLEAISQANALVLDKTGTLTRARPEVLSIIPAPGYERREILKIMACLEEHFPHPVSRAIVRQAKKEHVGHEEEHTEVRYVVAHGISSNIQGQPVYFGSRHYIEAEEGVNLAIFAPDIEREQTRGNSLLFLSIAGKAAGMCVISDPLRPEAPAVIADMRKLGFAKIAMLTGDDRRTADAIAAQAGIDEVYAHVLPNDKAEIVQRLNQEGWAVMMVGDGINDGPALSAASVGIAMGDGTDLARAVANVLLTQPGLNGLPFVTRLSRSAMRRIHLNVRLGVGLNSLYLLGALTGLLGPGLTAVLHNLTTISIALGAIRPYAIGREANGKIYGTGPRQIEGSHCSGNI
ncbi:MAG: heavy metal translocating P-type ATPase [Desulfovibrio sp.]|nr:heavy metal translocating P-type ATPase [Desulfovibrio sp.]